MKVRKLTFAERILGVVMVDDHRLGSKVSPSDEPVPVHGTRTTITCNQIENGWLVHRVTQNEYGDYRKPSVHFFPDLPAMSAGLLNIEASARLTGEDTSKTTYPGGHNSGVATASNSP